ncbi:uncharacterized protein LOC111059129 isoform X2 [Nilaparvata lugens]|uniref:uncharacterized protein LOC111059129 isoform X2 n=1 Tax=Nilaparvata lugens TaxID=108931 RepID=UPI00193CC21E|nr:uncharacterized protein LOC111059129 isoform X2 [Nilaparvata lugens]
MVSSTAGNTITYLFFYFTCLLGNGVVCLKLTNFDVPNHADMGSSATLVCEFDVDKAALNSVKWYKDEHEFFRYSPSASPSAVTQSFPLTGISLDNLRSDKNRVILNRLTYNSSGIYRCEVSTDLPDFKIAYESKNLTVVSFPRWGPEIANIQEHYTVGQMISGNCSVAPCHPKPSITWLINNHMVDRRSIYVDFQNDEDGRWLTSAWSTLHYELRAEDFQNENQAVEILCRVSLGGIPGTELENKFTSKLLSKKSTQESALQSLRNSGGSYMNNYRECLTLLSTLQILILFILPTWANIPLSGLVHAHS